jgi:hypothetical protein
MLQRLALLAGGAPSCATGCSLQEQLPALTPRTTHVPSFKPELLCVTCPATCPRPCLQENMKGLLADLMEHHWEQLQVGGWVQ